MQLTQISLPLAEIGNMKPGLVATLLRCVLRTCKGFTTEAAERPLDFCAIDRKFIIAL
jgi:hypothetical protein